MVELYGRDVSVISRHINNVFKEGEVGKESNLHFLQIAGSDRLTAFYSLDVIISVVYRVKSKRGVEFRKWANSVLEGYTMTQAVSLYHGSFVQGIYAFIMGVLLGTVAHLTDSLLGSVLFHMAANLIVTAYAYEPKLVDFLKSAPGLALCALAIIAGGILFALSVSKSKKKEISDQP